MGEYKEDLNEMIQNNKEIRWGIIGCGDVTEVKSGPAFQKAKNSRLVAVMRRDGDLARDYARRHQVPKWYDDADALIHDDEVDAVYIATPPAFHEDYTLKVAQTKKPVYVEKPMGMNHAECQEMILNCQKSEVPLFVAYYRRALERFIKIKEIIDQGLLGDIRLVSVLFCRPPLKQDYDHQKHQWWRIDPGISGGGYFIDAASHMIDLLFYFLGEMVSVSGKATNQADLYQVEDIVSCHFLFKNGVHGTGCWCYAAGTDIDHTEIIGSRGKLSYKTLSTGPVKLELNGQLEILYFDDPKHIQQPLIQTIVDELLEQGNCPSHGKSAAMTNWFVDQIFNTTR